MWKLNPFWYLSLQLFFIYILRMQAFSVHTILGTTNDLYDFHYITYEVLESNSSY